MRIFRLNLQIAVAVLSFCFSSELLAQGMTEETRNDDGGGYVWQPPFTEMRSKLPRIGATDGRIFIYREVRGGMSPTIFVNGKAVHDAAAGQVFYIDRPPDNYEVVVETEVERKASFVLNAGETKYVYLVLSMGIFVGHLSPTLVDEKTALDEMGPLEYVKAKPPK